MTPKPGRSGRSAEQAHFESLKGAAAEALSPLNAQLSEFTSSYNGLAYFATPNFHPNIAKRHSAAMIFGLESPLAQAGQNDFFHSQINGRRIALAGTAFGNTLFDHAKNPRTPLEFQSSRLNPEHHLTLTAPTWSTDSRGDPTIIGGVQLTFDPRFGILDHSETIKETVLEAKSLIQEVGEEFHALDSPQRPLWKMAGNLPPNLPNVYLIRWDTIGSTDDALGENYTELENYFDDMRGAIEEETRTFFGVRALNTGDGQNVLIYIPEYSRDYDINQIRRHIHGFGRTAITPLLQRILEAHKDIAGEYRQLSPDMRLTVGVGYAEPDNTTGQVFWDVTKTEETKTDPTLRQVRYTAAAKAALGINN